MEHYLGNQEDFYAVIDGFEDFERLVGRIYDQFGIVALPDIVEGSQLWWVLVDNDGADRAAEIVAEMVIALGGDRVVRLIRAAADGKKPVLAPNDSNLARVLFDHDELDSDLGQFVADYYQRRETRSQSDSVAPHRRA